MSVHDLSPIDAVIEHDGKIKCPNCRDGWLTRVLDSRATSIHDIPSIRRRRICAGCGARSTTYEILENVFSRMFKTQNAKQAFALKIVDLIDAEVRAELTKLLGTSYGGNDVDRR